LKEFALLKLKKLQILGFKSFCDRTDLRFQGDGIAAIVGPNGCGKSNISDAISWVLGEQSARLLRGVHMQDVIFAGTRDRKPTGMAEVSLTLVDPEVYGDFAEPEIEIQDDMPDDWDEAALRADRAADVERHSEEVRPGQNDEDASDAPATEQAAEVASRSAAASSSARSKLVKSRLRAASSALARASTC
jgi:chromosome segregation protein